MERENQQLLGQVMQQSSLSTPYGESEHPKYADQQQPKSGSPGRGNTPWGTEDTIREAVARTAEMESHLLQLNMEKKDLDGELQRLPQGAPRNVRDRKKKVSACFGNQGSH